MTATTEWCVLAVIQFNEQFTPCVVLSIHRNKQEAQELEDALCYKPHWPTTTRLVEYTDDIRKLKVGDYLFHQKIDVIMDKTGDVVMERIDDED